MAQAAADAAVQDDQLSSWAINKNARAAERRIREAHSVNIHDLDIRLFVEEVGHAVGIEIDEQSG